MQTECLELFFPLVGFNIRLMPLLWLQTTVPEPLTV